MIERQYIFPGVIEMNVQARRHLGVNIYLIDGGTEWALIDVGFLDELGDVLELIRRMGFALSACKMILATHADADHAQGLARASEILKCKVAAHPKSVAPLQDGDEILTYARIDAQNIHIPMPKCKVDLTIDEGDVLTIGDKSLDGLEHPGAHGRAARVPHGGPAVLGRQHLPGRLRGGDRRPPRVEPGGLPGQPAPHPGLRRQVPPAVARADLRQG